MTKNLHIPYCTCLTGKTIAQVNALIDHLGVQASIDEINWEDLYPHKPSTTIYLAHDKEHLFVKWHVHGMFLKAEHTQDLERVSADSCVEFFCQVPNDERYFNFEFNCIGVATASYRKGRAEDVVRLTSDEFAQIARYASMGNQPFDEIDGLCTWDVCVAIPFTLLSRNHKVHDKLLGNFYKCGDATSAKHYVSWNAIPTDKPDFHRPEYFGELHLKQ